MGLIFSKVLEMSMASGLLIVAVALLRIPLKKAPKWFMGVLWTIVAVRLLVPIQIESVLGFMPNFGGVLQQVTEKEPDMATTYYASEDALTHDRKLQQEDEALAEPSEQYHTGENAGGSGLSYFTALWIMGIILAVLYAAYSYISIWRKTRVSIRYRSSDKVYVCDEIDTPFIFGLIRPVIYLPSGLDHDTIVNVLAHEKAHLKRRDHLRKGLGFFILSIHWFNPFVWLAYILFCRDIELACDERVISTMTTDEKKSYAESLLSCSTKKRRMMVYPVAFCEVAVGTRIRQIFNYRKPTFYLVLLLAFITATLATCSFTRAADKVTVTPYKVEVLSSSDRISNATSENTQKILIKGITYTGEDYDDYVEKPQKDVNISAKPLSADIKINDAAKKTEVPATVEVKVQSSRQNESISVKTEEIKKSETQGTQETHKEVTVYVQEGNTHVQVETDNIKDLSLTAPVQEVVDVTQDIVNEVTDEVLIQGGVADTVADTAVDTAFGITTDTLGLVDSIFGW